MHHPSNEDGHGIDGHVCLAQGANATELVHSSISW